MKQRYNRWMKSVHPSETFLKTLESEMNRELFAKKSAARRRSTAVKIAWAAAALAILFIGALTLRGAFPDRVSPPPIADRGTAFFAPSSTATEYAASTPFSSPLPAETPSPMATEYAASTPSPSHLPVETPSPMAAERAASMPSPSPLPAETPSPIILETLDQGAWPSMTLENIQQFVSPRVHLADRTYQIHAEPDADSPVVGTLNPGDAWQPIESQESDDSPEGMEHITWWDGTALQTGWRVLSADWKEPVSPPYDLIQLPGKLRRETSLLYDRDPDAAAVTLAENALVYLYARYGDWLYVTTNGFDEEHVWEGWIPVDSVWALEWRDPAILSKVDLLADHVNLRDAPDGKIIATLSKVDSDGLIYSGTTVPGKDGDWYFVTYGEFMSKEGARSGYVSAQYAEIHTVTLGEELNLDGVVSAALRVRPTSLYEDAISFDQTLTGEALDGLLERLRGASTVSSYEKLCIPDVAEIRLTCADGSVVSLMISADDCPRLAFNGMIYDYRTAAERAEAFLNDGGKNSADILPEYFDELDSPIGCSD